MEKRDKTSYTRRDNGRRGAAEGDNRPAADTRRPLREARDTREEEPREAGERDDTLIWGKNPVTELLKSGTGVDTVMVADSLAPQVANYYTALGKEAGAVVKRVPAGKLQKLCGTPEHQGIAAWASRVEYATLDDLLAIAAEKNEPPFIVLCDGVEDPHNLGAILRSALLCGAHGVVIPRRGGVGVTGTVMKSSAGAAARIPVARVANMSQAVRTLKERNVFVYCADMGGQPLSRSNLSGAVGLVLGNEGAGVSALVRKLCDGVVSLDMAQTGTGVDSFNVSVAAGILLYDVMGRRNHEK